MNLVSSFYLAEEIATHTKDYIKIQGDNKCTVEVVFGQSGCQRVINEKVQNGFW
jgi:hypothetical protein